MLAKKEIKSTCSILITSKVTEVHDLGRNYCKIMYILCVRSALLQSLLLHWARRREYRIYQVSIYWMGRMNIPYIRGFQLFVPQLSSCYLFICSAFRTPSTGWSSPWRPSATGTSILRQVSIYLLFTWIPKCSRKYAGTFQYSKLLYEDTEMFPVICWVIPVLKMIRIPKCSQ